MTFLRELKANNERAWFQAHKARYESSVKQPAGAFAERLGEQLSLLSGIEQRSKIYRIHRDVRFAKDKTPYTAWLHIAFSPADAGGLQSAQTAGWFFALDPYALRFGTGSFMFDKPSLRRFRERLDSAEGLDLLKRLDAMRADGVRIGEPDLKRVPPGYPADHPCAELLRYKGISAWLDGDDTSPALDTGCIDHCLAQYARLRPLYDWLLSA